MKALSIRQPWAWLILHAGKDVENRSWSTRYRGRVLVHASSSLTVGDYEDAVETLTLLGIIAGGIIPPRSELERAGVVGSVEIVGCVTESASPWFFGEYGFVLTNPEPRPFTPYKGRLGFFDVPD